MSHSFCVIASWVCSCTGGVKLSFKVIGGRLQGTTGKAVGGKGVTYQSVWKGNRLCPFCKRVFSSVVRINKCLLGYNDRVACSIIHILSIV